MYLEDVAPILPSHNGHDFNNIIVQSKKYTVRTTDTTPIPFFDMIYGFKGKGVLGNSIKMFKKSMKIGVGLCHAKFYNAIVVNANQIFLGLVA